MAKNGNLHAAKAAKNDEFYTLLTDVERELAHYAAHFRGRTVLCDCNDAPGSSFWTYFHLNFAYLGLKRLIATHYEPDGRSYKLVYNGGFDGHVDAAVRSDLDCDGDFRSPECVGLLLQSDIVVTNVPFSLFREYVSRLMRYDAKFLIIGSMNAVTYKDFFPLLMSDRVWLGRTGPKSFAMPNGGLKKFGNILWYTNLDHAGRHEPLTLFREYNPDDYSKYDNYDAIEVSRAADIPCDYDGVMGVPISFLNHYCPEQFEIVGITLGNTVDYPMTRLYANAVQHNKDGSVQGGSKVNTRAAISVRDKPDGTVYYTADGVDGYLLSVYPRILIRRRK